jgi:hypothetical protein
MRILAIDPGTTESGYVYWNGEKARGYTVPNNELRLDLLDHNLTDQVDVVAIEMIASYGMPVGRETFETCVWIGRFIEASRIVPRLVFRKDVKLHLCQSARAKDGNVRQALIDKHGAPGTKKQPGKRYGISGHLWAALAVADYVADTIQPAGESTGEGKGAA